MSRTDKTRPWAVWNDDIFESGYIQHDHRFGACDYVPGNTVSHPQAYCQRRTFLWAIRWGNERASKADRRLWRRLERHHIKMDLHQARFTYSNDNFDLLPNPVVRSGADFYL